MLRNGLEAPLRRAVSVPESLPPSFILQSPVSFFHVVSRVRPRKVLGMTERRLVALELRAATESRHYGMPSLVTAFFYVILLI